MVSYCVQVAGLQLVVSQNEVKYATHRAAHVFNMRCMCSSADDVHAATHKINIQLVVDGVPIKPLRRSE